MTTAVLTEEEKARIRYHLGYPQTDPVASIQLGVPRSSQPMFLVETQMNRIPDTAIALIRICVARCDATEQRIMECQERMAAKSVDEVDLNPDEPEMLRKEYRYWVQKLADNLGAPINAYASAWQAGAQPLNVPVLH
jgi:hypothetical protein